MHVALAALGEVNRLNIVRCLATGTKTVGVLAQMIKLPIGNVSHHLGLLKNAKIVVSEQRGRFAHYKLNDEFCCVVNSELAITLPEGRVCLKIKA